MGPSDQQPSSSSSATSSKDNVNNRNGNSNGNNGSISAPLGSIDQHKLEMLDQRMKGSGEGGITESSFTPPRPRGRRGADTHNGSVISPASMTLSATASSDGVSNLTDGGIGNNNNNHSSLGMALAGADNDNDNVANQQLMSEAGAGSNASCQTVQHANRSGLRSASKKRDANSGNGKQLLSNALSTPKLNGSSKRKSMPSKRASSAIGGRLTSPKKARAKQNTPKASDGSNHIFASTKTPTSAAATELTTITESSKDASTIISQKQPPATTTASSFSSSSGMDCQNSRSESRGTLPSYFHSHPTTSNPPTTTTSATGNTSSTSRSQPYTPPALQSKSFATSNREKAGNNQRTLHSFLGIKDDKKQSGGGDEDVGNGSKKREGANMTNAKMGAVKDGANGDAIAAKLSFSATKSSASKPPLASSDNGRPKKKRARTQMKSSSACSPNNNAGSSSNHTNTNNTSTDHASSSHATGEQALTHEIKRLHSQIGSLQKHLDDANARNNSIRNNQTLIGANLQRQLKHQKAEMEQVKKEHGVKFAKAMEVMERLVSQESVREAKELRQKLASDGARLGRLVSSRVGNGLRSQVMESWEDGHAPRQLKTKRGELKKRREGLERQKEELARAVAAAAAPLASSAEPAQGGETIASQNTDPLSGSSADAGYATMNDLDRMEANETLRMHLDEVKRTETELDGEERALNIEKRAHVRALKLVANEDSSKFRSKRKLHDRYLLLNLLGKGGFSEVWRAFDLQSLQHVAVKIHQLEPSWSDAKKENYTKHVSREYEIHREVRHPRIVSLFDVFEIDTDSFATVLECCKGSDLDTLLKDKGRLGERDARAILLQILSGMRYLSSPSVDGQRQGIIHYDLKPGNILFDEAGNSKITDFGLSKIVDTAEEGDSMELTSQGAGTYWYLPPECFLMDQDVRISNKVDVWSIGVIYFQMLYGRRPFGDGQSQDHILRNQTMLNATEVHFPSKPCITEQGKAFIQDCLTYDQMGRPNMGQICEHEYLKVTTKL